MSSFVRVSVSVPALAWVVLVASTTTALAEFRRFDPAPAWPLCGRIADNPPTGWTPQQGCPANRWGNPDFADYPMNNTFGPRIMDSDGDRYDFHRGIDLGTDIGTPIFAVAPGQVTTAGNSSSYDDPVIIVRHFRPGASSCSPDGCYTTLYMHVSSWVVRAGDNVRKGQLIGYTGESDSDFAHLHFEVRDARPNDPSSSWQRDAIHPLQLLPYHRNPGDTEITIDSVNVSNPLEPVVTVTVTQPAAVRTLDVGRVELEIYDNDSRQSVAQAGLTRNTNGYNLNPPFFDFDLHNYQYTHKNSSAFPWSSFSTCPFASQHGSSYNANVHTCRHDPDDEAVGLLNGMRIRPAAASSPTLDYRLTVEFTEVTGVADAQDLCVVAYVRSARGEYGLPATWNCKF